MKLVLRLLVLLMLVSASHTAMFAKDKMSRVEYEGLSFLMENYYTKEEKDGNTTFNVEGKNHSYWLTLMKAPCHSGSMPTVVEGVLDGACDGIIKSLGATELKRSTIILGSKYVGRDLELRFKQNNANGYLHQKIYLIERKLVCLAAGNCEHHKSTKDNAPERFLNSLVVEADLPK